MADKTGIEWTGATWNPTVGCRVFARGTMNSVGLEFEDGFKMVTSGNALRRAK